MLGNHFLNTAKPKCDHGECYGALSVKLAHAYCRATVPLNFEFLFLNSIEFILNNCVICSFSTTIFFPLFLFARLNKIWKIINIFFVKVKWEFFPAKLVFLNVLVLI